MNILIWGAGKYGKIFFDRIDKNKATCIGFIESHKSKEQYLGIPVFDATELPTINYDYILVAILHPEGIQKLYSDIGGDVTKLCFAFSEPIFPNGEQNCKKASQFLTIDGTDIICRNHHLKLSGYDKIENDAIEYSKLNTRATFNVRDDFWKPYRDDYESAGTLDSYFWQDLWASQKIIHRNPQVHYDIGSRINGFILALAASSMRVKMIDIRPLDSQIENFSFVQGDATHLYGFQDNSMESISALCSIEHFGLGRYGDAINPDACFQCFDAIQKKVKPNGIIYISVPIGWEHLEFNAHRIFYASTVIKAFSNCELLELSMCDNSGIYKNIGIHELDNHTKYIGEFGLFEFIKKDNNSFKI